MCNVQHLVTNHTEVKFLRNEEQHCLLPSLVDDFTCVHSKNALITHILSTLFSSTSVLFSCTPFGTNIYKIQSQMQAIINITYTGPVKNTFGSVIKRELLTQCETSTRQPSTSQFRWSNTVYSSN